MELTPKQELFAQAIVKHQGHQTNAYLELHPHVKEASARHSASVLLTNVYIKQRVYEILEQNGLGLKEVAAKLSKLMNYKTYYYETMDKQVLGDNIGIQLEGLTLIVRLYGSLLKSGVGVGLTPEEIVQIQQMIKDFEEKQDNS